MLSTRVIDNYGLIPTEGEIGIEIEMEGHPLAMPDLKAESAKYWRADKDNSLRGPSLEYILTRPVSREEVPVALKALKGLWKDFKCKPEPSDRCGVHVHVNCQQKTLQEVLILVCLYLVVEDLLVKWCGEPREGNIFCLRARDAEQLIHVLCNSIVYEGFHNIDEDYIRYASINLGALGKYGSIEFRAMQTPKDISLVGIWVKMLLCVVDAAKVYKHLHEIVEGISCNGGKKFVQMIFGDLAEELYCPELDKLLTESVRRVQDLAYFPQIYAARKKNNKLVGEPKKKTKTQVLNVPPQPLMSVSDIPQSMWAADVPDESWFSPTAFAPPSTPPTYIPHPNHLIPWAYNNDRIKVYGHNSKFYYVVDDKEPVKFDWFLTKDDILDVFDIDLGDV